MSLVQDFADYLIGKGEATVLGVDIFGSYMPDEPDVLICLTEHSGPAPTILGAQLQLEQPELQVVNRAPTYGEAHDTARRLYQWLAHMPDGAVNATRYLCAMPVGQPSLMERDHHQRVVMFSNWYVTREVVIV